MIFIPYIKTLCATVSFAELASANIVGYMDKAADNASGYTWMANTFQKVDGTVTKLSDLSFKENLAPTAAKLYLLDKAGATLVDANGKKCIYVYLNPTKAGTRAVPGWYYDGTASNAMTGENSEGWANDVEIPYGQGFGIQRSTTAATLVFSGSVAAEDQEIEAKNASGYTWMGNVMPTDLTLADLSFKENLAPTAAKLYLLDKAGATLVDENGKKCIYVYLNPTKAGTRAVPGWYFDGTASNAMTGETSPGWANNVSIKAGQGFGIQRSTTAATLVIPSPLVDNGQ